MKQALLVRSVAIFLLAAGLCGALSAATVSKLNDDVLAPLRRSVGAKQIHLSNVPLYAHGTAKIDLDEFQVWAPDGKVIVDDGKSITYLDPPPMRFFRGMVNGDPESFAYFSVDGTTGAIHGLVSTRDGKYVVDTARRKPLRTHDQNLVGDFDYFLTATDDSDEIPMTGQTWSCGVEKLPALPHINERILTATDAGSHHVIAQGKSGTQAYAIAVEVETDFELYSNAGSNVTTLTNYVTDLSGAVSTIYNRDLHTDVVQQNLHVYTASAGADPWAATDANSGLTELGGYYHTNHLSLKRSAVVMLSGKPTQSGVAWEGVIGEGDFASNQAGTEFGGTYAWCGSIGGLGSPGIGSVPDPNATTNETLYGMPSGSNTYWPLEEYAHELGHNLAGHHTHCVVISGAEASGTNHPSQHFVDVCSIGEIDQDGLGGTSACATGTASAPTEKGTIMSYCHTLFVGAVPQSRYTFGQAAEVSHHELDDFMLNASGPLQPYGGSFNIVTAVGSFSMSTITSPSSVAANSTGNIASVTPSNGATVTYSWTITGGTIPGSSTGSSVTYTAGASGSVVLRVTAYNTPANNVEGFPSGTVGITDTKTVTINTLLPPTNVMATAITASAVTISWTASAGAAKYHVFRSVNNSTYVQVNGETTTTTSFNDTGAVHALISNASYLYRVRSVDGSNVESADSNKDLATTIIFTDATITQQSTTIKAAHITQLRTAMTAICTLAANPSPCSTAFTDPSLSTSIKVMILHLTELRAKLNAARSALGLTAQSYAEGSITTATTIKAAQINELRSGVQ
jgi:hypothetical protein